MMVLVVVKEHHTHIYELVITNVGSQTPLHSVLAEALRHARLTRSRTG